MVRSPSATGKPASPSRIQQTPPPGNYRHEPQQSEQTHIGIAYPSLPETDDDYYTLRLAMEILSGGMCGRLFTEVREKRGLVYNVWAGYSSLKGSGSILGYAGTSNDRAAGDARHASSPSSIRLQEGVTDRRARPRQDRPEGLDHHAGRIHQRRAGAIAHDFFMRGRIRTLDEIKTAIDAVTLDQVNAFLKKNPPGPFTIVTVGPKELKTPV